MFICIFEGAHLPSALRRPVMVKFAVLMMLALIVTLMSPALPTPGMTVDAQGNEATLIGQIETQRVNGANSHVVPLSVDFFTAQAGLSTGVPLVHRDVVSSPDGSFTVTQIPPQTYDVRVKYAQATSMEVEGVQLAAGQTVTVTFGRLPAGDADNSNSISPADFTDLKQTFTLPTDCAIQQQIPLHCADFDANGTVSPNDFSLLKQNFGSQGQLRSYGNCPVVAADPLGHSPTRTSGNCAVVRINEVESNGGVPGDWIELYNPTGFMVSLAGYVVKDNDNTHVYTIPAGTAIAAGGYYLVEEASLGFGLGAADSARLFAPGGATLLDSYSWTAHAATTFGRCPNGSGGFTTTTSVTKGAANDCSIPIKINEIESSGGNPGDWVELFNPGLIAFDLGGFVFRDSNDGNSYTIPALTSIAGNGYYLLEEAAFGFGLGSADSARLFAADGTTLIDSYTWTSHAASTYGRCPNGTGAFTTTDSVTKGTANVCPGDVIVLPWPGSADVTIASGANVFGTNLSGLTQEPSGNVNPGVLWAVRNDPGTLYRLLWNGTIWTPDTNNDWSSGKALRYPGGTGNPDAEGVTLAATVADGIYVSTERDGSGASRNAILRFDVAAVGTTLNAVNDWNITAALPVVGANAGIEAVTWVPDAFLTARGFFDTSKNHTYVPGEYPSHGTGLFIVGLEANGSLYAFALNHADNTSTLITTIFSGFSGVMGLEFDRELNYLWAVCDNNCSGRSAVLEINGLGQFVVTRTFDRPANMPNLNNEGFALAAQAECTGGQKPVYWADDDQTGGFSIRRGTLTCTAFAAPVPLRPAPANAPGSPPR
jgi:hypothetical protein